MHYILTTLAICYAMLPVTPICDIYLNFWVLYNSSHTFQTEFWYCYLPNHPDPDPVFEIIPDTDPTTKRIRQDTDSLYWWTLCNNPDPTFCLISVRSSIFSSSVPGCDTDPDPRNHTSGLRTRFFLQWVSKWQQKKKLFSRVFCLLLFVDKFTLQKFKDIKFMRRSKNCLKTRNRVFLQFLLVDGRIPIQFQSQIRIHTIGRNN